MDYDDIEEFIKDGHLPECRFHGAPLDVCNCMTIRMLDKIRRLEEAQAQKRFPMGDDFKPAIGPAIKVRYTNWRKRTTLRTISPVFLYLGSTEFHKTVQWLVHCWDHDKNAWRDYALIDCDFALGGK